MDRKGAIGSGACIPRQTTCPPTPCVYLLMQSKSYPQASEKNGRLNPRFSLAVSLSRESACEGRTESRSRHRPSTTTGPAGSSPGPYASSRSQSCNAAQWTLSCTSSLSSPRCSSPIRGGLSPRSRKHCLVAMSKHSCVSYARWVTQTSTQLHKNLSIGPPLPTSVSYFLPGAACPHAPTMAFSS